MVANPMLNRQVKLMGGPFSIAVYPPDGMSPDFANKAIALALAEVARLEDLLTDYRPSPLTQLNLGAALGGHPVPEELFRIIDFSLGVSRDSQGAFDITYATVGQLWREAFRTGKLPSSESIERAMQRMGFQKVVLLPEGFRIRFSQPDLKIGLGGVGKGYAVDAAARVLKEMGLESFIVNGAGDIRVSSARRAPRSWRVGIKNPFVPGDAGAGMICVSDGAVATSGDYERFLIVNGRRYHHVIDPRTGYSRQDIRSVSVLAPTALQADVYATTTMALGRDEGAAFLARHTGVRAVIIQADGGVKSIGFRKDDVRVSA